MSDGIRAALFDIDGTLVDTNDLHAEAWARTFRDYGVDLPLETIRAQVGKGSDMLMPALLPEALVKSSGERIAADRGVLFARDYLPLARPFAGVKPLFRKLVERGVAVLLASSGKASELDYYQVLLDCRTLVSATVSGDDVDHSKPHPDIFAVALQKAGVTADQAVVVGDTPYDMQAAGALGIAAIALRCGGWADAPLREAGAAEIHDDPAALLNAGDQSLLWRD